MQTTANLPETRFTDYELAQLHLEAGLATVGPARLP
jgi:hypothetical protein